MIRVIKKIEIVGSFEINERIFVKIKFSFEGDLSDDVLIVEKKLWLSILEDSKKDAKTMSWNDLKKHIYYSCVMQTRDRFTDFNI